MKPVKIKTMLDLPGYKAGLIFEYKEDLWIGGTYAGWWFNGAPLEDNSWIATLLSIHIKADIDTVWFKNVS